MAEFGDFINDKIVCTFKNKEIGEWVLELLRNKINFKTRNYFNNNYYECFEYEFEKYGQTLCKFCFDNIKDVEQLEKEITYKCRWQNGYARNTKIFDDKIKKIIMLQNKLKI